MRKTAWSAIICDWTRSFRKRFPSPSCVLRALFKTHMSKFWFLWRKLRMGHKQLCEHIASHILNMLHASIWLFPPVFSKVLPLYDFSVTPTVTFGLWSQQVLVGNWRSFDIKKTDLLFLHLTFSSEVNMGVLVDCYAANCVSKTLENDHLFRWSPIFPRKWREKSRKISKQRKISVWLHGFLTLRKFISCDRSKCVYMYSRNFEAKGL